MQSNGRMYARSRCEGYVVYLVVTCERRSMRGMSVESGRGMQGRESSGYDWIDGVNGTATFIS